MKVVFKLNAEQLARAKAIVSALVCSAEEPDQNQVWCGNLLGYQGHSFSFNSNQNLQLNEDAGTIEYDGERNPLQQDGGLNVLYTVASGKTPDFYRTPMEQRFQWYAARAAAVQQLRVVLYKTTDERLQWWETLDDLVSRMTEEELAKEMVNYKGKILPKAILYVARPLNDRYGHIEPGMPGYNRLAAEGKLDIWRIVRSFKLTY